MVGKEGTYRGGDRLGRDENWRGSVSGGLCGVKRSARGNCERVGL